MDPQTAALLRAFDATCLASDALPEAALSVQDRMTLGASCFREGDALVSAVAWALRHRGALYPDVTVRADELEAGLDRSLACRRLAHLYEGLARCAMDQHLMHQAGAVRRALSVVEQVRLTALLPHVFPRGRERQDALLPAERILRGRQLHRRRLARRRALAAAQSAPPTPPPPRRPRSPRGAATAKAMRGLGPTGESARSASLTERAQPDSAIACGRPPIKGPADDPQAADEVLARHRSDDPSREGAGHLLRRALSQEKRRS